MERSGMQKISRSILQGNRTAEKAPCFRSSGTRIACIATQERRRRTAWKRGGRSAPVFGFPPLCGVKGAQPLGGGVGWRSVQSSAFPGLQGGSSPLLGAMGAKPPDTPR